jgi:hypothetical protein
MVFLVQFGKANTRGFFKDFNLIVFEKLTRACFPTLHSKPYTIVTLVYKMYPGTGIDQI